MKLRQQPLARQLALAVAAACVVLFSMLVLTMSWLSSRNAVKHLEQTLGRETSAIAIWVEDSLRAAQDGAKLSMLRYHKMLPGPLVLSGETAPSGDLPAVPVIKSGATVLNGNMEFLTQVRNAVEGEPAVLVLQQGKLVRVATFLKNKDGSPRFGSSPEPDSPEARSVLAGQTYLGLVQRDGKFYMSIFEPIFDGKHVVGALSVRVSMDGILERLAANVKSVKIGDSGAVFIYAPAANTGESRFIVHPTLAGKTFGEAKLPEIETLTRAIDGKEQAIAYYHAADPGDGRRGEKVVALHKARSTGWVVGAGSWVSEFTTDADTLRNELIAAVLLCAGLIIGVVVMVAQSRLKPVGRIVEVVQRMGQGRLNDTVAEADPASRNEVDQLSVSLQRMQAGMSDIIRRIGGVSHELEGATNALQDASRQVLERSAQQSESAATLASAVEQLSVSVSQVSAKAGEAQGLATEAATAALAGNARVAAVVDDMTRIETEIRETASAVSQLGARTAAIGSIINLIQDVADQTNLLALNAAIEAARAGEQGRGFAVVADEVRKLAERTTLSTAEISQAIESVQVDSRAMSERIGRVAGRVTEGMRSATDAGRVLSEIADQSQRAVTAVAGIADSTREQSATSHEIARGVENIARMADNTRAISQANSKDSERLRAMADEMGQMVGRFRV